MRLATKPWALSNTIEFLGISKHGSCYHGLFIGVACQGWQHFKRDWTPWLESRYCKMCIHELNFNGSQRAYSYVSLFDFQLFHHCSSPLPLSRLRMRDGNLTRTWLAILVANALLPELLQPTLALLNQQILNLGHQSEDRGATSYSSQAQQWHPDSALFKVGDYDLLIHVRVM